MLFDATTRLRYPKPAGKRPEMQPFSRQEMKAILREYWRFTPETFRDKAIIVFLYRGAARIGATLRMMPEDIDWERNIVRIYKDKGGKTRFIALDALSMRYMSAWNQRRKLLGATDQDPFFCICRPPFNKPVDRAWVIQRFRKYCRKVGIERPVNLHLLRHTGASELLEEGFNVATISRVLGHSSIQTTYRYLHEIRPDMMNKQFASRQW